MPDVRALAPPDAKNIIIKKSEIPGEYFHILVSGVILRSLGRIEHGLCSDPGGSPGTPPLTLTGSQKSFSRKTSVCEAVQHLANEKQPSFVGLSPPKYGIEEEKVAWSSFDLSLCGGFSVDNTLQGTHCSSHNL